MSTSARRTSLGLFLVSAVVVGACAQGTGSEAARSTANPWTHLDFPDPSDGFHFAVVADRAGWHRPGVFKLALDRLQELDPTFVMSVGDLLDTGIFAENPDLFTEQAVEEGWTELEAMVDDLPMPFFFVPGNNELRNDAMVDIWLRRFGRTYYHFVYENVLFVVLNSEDPPGPRGSISDAQLDWLRGVLTENADVRWTFLFLHKRMWSNPTDAAWLAVEEALGSRPRTVFGGHAHRYSRYENNGHVYYGLATTGGNSPLSGVIDGYFDHVLWVTMTDRGPRIANLMLNGIWGDDPANEIGERPGPAAPDSVRMDGE